MTKLRVGIIGVGTIAKVAHLPNYAKRDDVDVVAFADLETQRVEGIAAQFAADHGVAKPTVYATAQDMFAHERLDAVSICTPNGSHVELALIALAAGVHVLLEKPMAVALQDADALVAAANQSGKTLMVGMSNRYRQDSEVLKRYVDSGVLGEIYYAKTRILRRRGTPTGWFTDLSIAGGGPLMDIGVHALDLTWWLAGTPQPKSVTGFLYQGIGNRDKLDFNQTWSASSAGNAHNEVFTTEDFASAFIRFQNGFVLQLEVSWAINGAQDDALKVDIFGTHGGVSLDPLQVYGTKHGVLTAETPSVPSGNLYQREVNHFIDCIHTGNTPCSTVDQGRSIVQMLTGIVTSSAEGREVLL